MYNWFWHNDQSILISYHQSEDFPVRKVPSCAQFLAQLGNPYSWIEHMDASTGLGVGFLSIFLPASFGAGGVGG